MNIGRRHVGLYVAVPEREAAESWVNEAKMADHEHGCDGDAEWLKIGNGEKEVCLSGKSSAFLNVSSSVERTTVQHMLPSNHSFCVEAAIYVASDLRLLQRSE